MSFLTVYSEAAMRNDYLEYISIRQTVKNSEYFSTAVYVLDFFFNVQSGIRLDRFTTEMTKGCHYCLYLAGY